MFFHCIIQMETDCGEDMNSIKVGDRLRIHCYKHDGRIHRAWDEATVLYIDSEKLICGNNKTKVTEGDGRSHRTKEPAIMFFYRHSWFNVIGQLKKQGLFYYCNMASPFLIDEDVIKYIDYDLDLRVFPDGGFKVLDRNEYKYHKELMHYPEEIDKILTSELTELIDMKRAEIGPFTKGIVYEYYEIYKKLKKSEKN